MTRLAAIAGIALLAAACTAGDTGAPSVPESVVIVDDSIGSILGDAEPSPDGSRIAFSRTVAGRSNIFVADANGANPVKLTSGVWDQGPVWSPDGRLIAYEGEDPDFDVLVVPSDGSAPVRRVTAHEGRDRPYGWTADGKAVVAVRRLVGFEHTVVAPLDGGQARRLGPAMPGDMHAAFSPDGSRMIFDVHALGGGASIWIQDSVANGWSEPRQLTSENTENFTGRLAWSPDGNEIAYISRRTGTADIWIMDLRTGASRPLTTDIRDDDQPTWSPDGKWIAFLSGRGGQRDIWLVAAAGGNAVRVTNDLAVEANVRWSPDGRSLSFGRTVSSSELQLLPADGGQPRSLLKMDGYTIAAPVRSPDGNTILFMSDRSGNLDIWSLSASGGEPVPFIAGAQADFAPRYSPDGSHVMFASSRGGEPDLWVVPSGGGAERNISNSPGPELDGVWSPDGSRIAFASGFDLWIAPAAGGAATRVTNAAYRPSSIEWSPDGRTLFFVGNRPAGGRELYRVPSAGGNATALGAPRDIGNSALSPDGSQLSYSVFERGWAFVEVIPAAGGKPRRLTPGSENIFHPRAIWYPDGSRLLVLSLDLAGNRDAIDLAAMRVDNAALTPLTSTAYGSEAATEFMPNGREVLVVVNTTRIQVRRVAVDGVTGGR